MEDFKWTDELVKEFTIHIRQAFEYPNTYNGGVWLGLHRELEKWKEEREKEYILLNKKVNVSYIDFQDYRNHIMAHTNTILFEDLMKGFFQSEINKTTP